MDPLFLVSIDLGLRGCGVSSFNEQRLFSADYVRNEVREGDSLEAITGMILAVVRTLPEERLVYRIVLEWPQVYQGSKQKGDPNDLVTLAAIGMGILMHFPRSVYRRYLPREWKGQVDPDEMIRRILSRLTDDEKGHISTKVPKSLMHNVIDSIGIGLKSLGRLEPHRVLPGAK